MANLSGTVAVPRHDTSVDLSGVFVAVLCDYVTTPRLGLPVSGRGTAPRRRDGGRWCSGRGAAPRRRSEFPAPRSRGRRRAWWTLRRSRSTWAPRSWPAIGRLLAEVRARATPTSAAPTLRHATRRGCSLMRLSARARMGATRRRHVVSRITS